MPAKVKEFCCLWDTPSKNEGFFLRLFLPKKEIIVYLCVPIKRMAL